MRPSPGSRITREVRPSVCLSVHLSRSRQRKSILQRSNLEERLPASCSNWQSNFEFSRSKFKVTGGGKESVAYRVGHWPEPYLLIFHLLLVMCRRQDLVTTVYRQQTCTERKRQPAQSLVVERSLQETSLRQDPLHTVQIWLITTFLNSYTLSVGRRKVSLVYVARIVLSNSKPFRR